MSFEYKADALLLMCSQCVLGETGMPIFLVTPYYYYHANSLSQHSPVSDVILESSMWQKKLEQLCVDSISQVLLFLPLISNLAPVM